MSLAFENAVETSWPADRWRDVAVLVGVSGGPDSVALLAALSANKGGGKGKLVAAHFNHQWRGEESDRDERFVQQLAESLGVQCRVSRGDRAKSEDEARHLRYQFFEELAGDCGARYIVTAHTADDQAETILHRILRGTGLSGLAGIPRTRVVSQMTVIIRPLLQLRRADVLNYLECRGQAYRVDSSNDDNRFTRNRIRNELLPELSASFNPNVVDAILRLGGLAKQAHEVIQQQVELIRDRIVAADRNGLVLDCDRLQEVEPYVRRELFLVLWKENNWPLREMGQQQWNDLQRLAGGADRREITTMPGQIRVERTANQLMIGPL